MAEHTDDLLTIDEVSQMTRRPVATLRYWRHLGTGPKSFKLGKRILYRACDVRDWIAAQYEATSAETVVRNPVGPPQIRGRSWA